MATDSELTFTACQKLWESQGYVPLSFLTAYAKTVPLVGSLEDCLHRTCKSFNCTDTSLNFIKTASDAKADFDKLVLYQYLSDNLLDQVPYDRISAEEFKIARGKLFESPETFMALHLEKHGYPYYAPGKTYSFHPKWVDETVRKSNDLFIQFSSARRSDTAILVGNGPSLNKIDLNLFCGQDVFISNYAIKNETIAKHAMGVAVTNYLVAEQEPYWFQLNHLWKFYPIWLAGTLPPTDTSVLLNAVGGELFYSEDVTKKVAWHSTVTYFWLQILYSAGYKKVVMTGFDHYYHQEANAKEGDLIKQTTDDQNHFDPNYFKGKNWQAADVSKMEDTYRLAKNYYEADGREIVNATVGGHLEVFRRSELVKEIDRPRLFGRIARLDPKPKIAIVSAFWKGDVVQAELHWRLINKLGVPSSDHIYLYKHHSDLLPPTTLPRVVCADIENRYPDAAKLPHPAGPNLVFAHTVKMLLDTPYTHFFWLEPDCVPTDSDWLKPFINRLAEYPDEPIIGTGGGTVTPGKLHWRNHFAGCSMYSLKHLAELDWEGFIKSQLDISFDVWLSVNLGYIKLGNINNEDQSSTIIFGKNRHDWSELRKPKSLVYGMFEHWRPEKIMTPGQLEERLSWPGFSLYHAIKDRDVVVRLFKKLPKSASTIVINYNNDKYLLNAIESALSQTIDSIKYEVIVVDDGSTDSSKNIINSFGDRIKPIFLTHGILNGNFNQQRALKAGLSVAKGEVVLLLDGDDVFCPDKIQAVCEMFDDPDVVLAQHTLKLIDGDGAPMGKIFKAFPTEAIKPETYQKLRKVNLFQATSALAFRRSYIHSQLGKLCVDDHINTWLDVRLTRFSPYFGKVYSSDKRLAAWRRHENSDSIRTDNVADRIKAHETWFDDVSAKEGFPAVSFKWKEEQYVVGPYCRDDHAHWDETLGIRQFTISNKTGTMIDVGAHEGYALMPFLNDGWHVFAFEPDNKNRGKLLDRLGKHKYRNHVSLDTRCVSNKSQKGMSFFTSEQSTGISGLSAFHETHVEAQKVDITTLTEFFKDNPLPAVDFLKIDTEGHDLFVLQGFPWERGTPAVIECEFEDTKTVPLGYTFHDLARFLVGKGYTVYVSEWHPIIRYGIRHDWRQLMRYPCVLADPKGWGNLLAFRDPIDQQALIEAVKKVLKVGGGESPQKPVLQSKPPAPVKPAVAIPVSGAILGFRFEPGTHFTSIAPNQWRFTDDEAKQKLWIAAMVSPISTAGRTFGGILRVMADRAITINVSIGRHGKKGYEGSTQRIVLTPGAPQAVQLNKQFKRDHEALKLQAEVVELINGGSAVLTIDQLGLSETLASIQERLDSSHLNLSTANRLFREGDYTTALGIYLWLSQRHPLSMYVDNIVRSAKQIGFSWVKTPGDLNWLLDSDG